MGTHLSQIVAVEKDVKEKAARERAAALAVLGSSSLLTGLTRTYTPKNDEDEHLPPESTRVQQTVHDVLKGLRARLSDLFDVVATKDYTNCTARAPIVVDGTTLLPDVPVTYLLFLEKHLAELLSFVRQIPVLDPAYQWEWNQYQRCFMTPGVETTRTKKELRVLELSPATKEHPRQVQVYQDDVPTGRWLTIRLSGALPMDQVVSMIERLEKLQKAVKFAREEANRSEVSQQKVGDQILHYLFG